MLGIDVSKAKISCTLLDPTTHQVRWQQEYPNTTQGVRRLLHRLPSDCALVLEPTGRYGHTVAEAAQQTGRRVLLAQPKKARHFLASEQPRAKTDRLDSRGLALYALCRPLLAYPLKDAMHEELDQLLAARKGLSKALSALQQQQRELPRAATYLEEGARSLRQQMAQLDAQLKQLTAGSSAAVPGPAAAVPGAPDDAAVALPRLVAELQRVPGIGLVTATTAASCLTAHRFVRGDAFVAYIGLDVSVRQSGTRSGRGTLTKNGHGELRRLLYLAAQASLRCADSPFKVQYERELAKGLPRTAALCAVARKLARLCWSIHAHGTAYDPKRVFLPKTLDA